MPSGKRYNAGEGEGADESSFINVRGGVSMAEMSTGHRITLMTNMSVMWGIVGTGGAMFGTATSL